MRIPVVQITSEEYEDLEPFLLDPEAYGGVFKEIVGNAIWTKIRKAEWELNVVQGRGTFHDRDRIVMEEKEKEADAEAESSQD